MADFKTPIVFETGFSGSSLHAPLPGGSTLVPGSIPVSETEGQAISVQEDGLLVTPAGFISGESGNSIRLAADKKLFVPEPDLEVLVPEIVSDDPSNQIVIQDEKLFVPPTDIDAIAEGLVSEVTGNLTSEVDGKLFTQNARLGVDSVQTPNYVFYDADGNIRSDGNSVLSNASGNELQISPVDGKVYFSRYTSDDSNVDLSSVLLHAESESVTTDNFSYDNSTKTISFTKSGTYRIWVQGAGGVGGGGTPGSSRPTIWVGGGGASGEGKSFTHYFESGETVQCQVGKGGGDATAGGNGDVIGDPTIMFFDSHPAGGVAAGGGAGAEQLTTDITGGIVFGYPGRTYADSGFGFGLRTSGEWGRIAAYNTDNTPNLSKVYTTMGGSSLFGNTAGIIWSSTANTIGRDALGYGAGGGGSVIRQAVACRGGVGSPGCIMIERIR